MPVRAILILRSTQEADSCSIFDPPEDHAIQRGSKFTGPNGRRSKDQTFGFDRVFDENTTQADVYEATTRNLLDSVLDGYNATVFAYGATGCGKTHTVTGTVQAPGVIFLTMQELFERIGEINDEKHTEVSLSYLEIYNETIRDLLVPGGSKQSLMLREDANQAVSVAGLTSHHPQNVQEVMDMIVRGNEYRTMSPTEANATSSRSHAVLQINVSQKDRNADINEPHTMATLSIIDLAGSERASATKNRGERLQEGANINKSLLALGSCINALCDPRKKNHVPYRNSKLTRLLKFSLGGNCKTVMIVCVSPSSQHFDETQNTLRYANRAKNIQTKVTRNVYNVNRHVKDFLVKIDEQLVLINELKQQQKDHEGAAFAKFQRQAEKRELIAREGVARIRNAYDNSEKDRIDKVKNMKKLRQIERRIAIISSWVAAFDQVCDNSEEEATLQNISAMRKTAHGILLELENSRHHYHQRLAKSNWERAIDSALQNGIRQLKEADARGDGQDGASLSREVEILKANADREALNAVAEDEKGGDAGLVQVLLQTHFETVAAIQSLMAMDEEEAVGAAKNILAKILNGCTTAMSHVIKPDGSLIPTQAFPPTRSGTPKRKKQVASPLKPMLPPSLAGNEDSYGSPIKMSPKRRKAAKKGVSFTPKKKSPGKGLKRGVRWRDDTAEGALADFEKTPQRKNLTPDTSSSEPIILLPPTLSTSVLPDETSVVEDLTNSSPIPEPPVPSLEVKPKQNRFKTGFLAKKTDGSPLAPTLSSFSSDSDHSPLRELEPGKGANRSSLQYVQSLAEDPTLSEGANSSGSEVEDRLKANKSDVMQIKTAIKRVSSVAPGNPRPSSRQRRRSPPGASSGSPPNDINMFTASHARRMVRSEKENDFRASILSPCTAPVVKHAGQRRTTMGTMSVNENRSKDMGVPPREAVRPSTAVTGSGGSGGHTRGSLLAGAKGAWR